MRKLSIKDIEIARLIAAGHSNSEIGEQLGYAEDTIRSDLKMIYRKLKLRGRPHPRVDLARFAFLNL